MDAALFLCPPTARQSGYEIPPSFKPNSDPQQDISGIRYTLLKVLLVPIVDEIAKVCHDTFGVLVVLFESFQGCEPLQCLGASNPKMN